MFFLFFLAHLVADFALQPYWLVARKRRWDGLLIHGAIVLVCMLALALINSTALALWPLMLGITLIHVCADWWKVHRADQLMRPAIIPFLLDQGIHALTLIGLLSSVLPQSLVWSQALPGTEFAVYAAAYLIAGLAVPIGVMIGCDPGFRHAALAPAARLRSLAIGTLGVGLVLFAGTFALPIGLMGLVFWLRKPADHPLDRLGGRLCVLGSGALLGAAVTLLAR